MNIKVKSTIISPLKLGKQRLDEFIANKSMEWENGVKEIISNADAIDTGEMVNSIHTEINPNGFTGISSSKHMKYHEFRYYTSFCAVL